MAFAEGLDTGANNDELESHVADCAVCASVLASIDAAGGLVQKLRSAFLMANGPSKPASETDSCKGDSISVAEMRTYLQASERKDSLGLLGHYELLELHGRGTFGSVFKAFDEILHRIVAIKVLPPDQVATAKARKRFLQEARAVAAIRHENVVQIYSVHDQPLPYLVMEFIPGESLQQRLDRSGPLNAVDVSRIGRQIANGLAAAHARGLIHRDIKPGNILIDLGGEERVKITDFGLARGPDDDSSSQQGLIAGTPLFMSPEQIDGAKLDQRSDLFSLGSVLYVLITGHYPFNGTNTMETIKSVRHDLPRPISELVPGVPQYLCSVISRLHSKQPALRFKTAKEVADALDPNSNPQRLRVGSSPSDHSGPVSDLETADKLITSVGKANAWPLHRIGKLWWSVPGALAIFLIVLGVIAWTNNQSARVPVAPPAQPTGTSNAAGSGNDQPE